MVNAGALLALFGRGLPGGASLQYSTAFYVAFSARWPFLDGRADERLFFMAVGMLTSRLPGRTARRRSRGREPDFVKICLSWGIGYAGIMERKNAEVFAEAGGAMGNRLGAVDDSGVELA